MNDSKQFTRMAQVAVSAATIALLCAGCAAPASNATGSGSGSSGGSGGSVAAVCAVGAEPAVDTSDPKAGNAKFLKYWDKIATNAPSPIRADAATVADAWKRIVAGQKGVLIEDKVSAALNKVDGWLTKNCTS